MLKRGNLVSAFKNILVAVDTSLESELIVSKAKDLASKYESNLYVIHVVEPVILESGYELAPALNIDFEQNLVTRGQDFLDALEDKYDMHFVKKIVSVGSTKTEIQNTAMQLGINLIVLGSHGRHGVARLLGSTANAILHGAPCDVMCIRIGE